MRKILWVTLALLPLVTGGLVYARSLKAHKAGYVCPITGEELPCPKCCPLNQH
jgi:hypothetical protein